MRPRRACMSDNVLCDLVFAKCNVHLLDQVEHLGLPLHLLSD
jgi:hypothetical protein